MNTYKVYIQTDDNNSIVAINSSAFLADTTGWTQIDEGSGDRFHHAQGHYLDKPLMTVTGIYQYRYIDGEVIEKTTNEIAAEEAAVPPPPPPLEEHLAAQEQLAANQEQLITSQEQRVSAQEEASSVMSTTLDILFTEILPALTGV
jgi:hypothetical protein